jgi:hypothetical protein
MPFTLAYSCVTPGTCGPGAGWGSEPIAMRLAVGFAYQPSAAGPGLSIFFSDTRSSERAGQIVVAGLEVDTVEGGSTASDRKASIETRL